MAAHDSESYTGCSSDMPLDHRDRAEYISDLNFTEDSMHSPQFSNHLSQSSLPLRRSASWHRLSPSQSETSHIFSDNNRINSSRACLIEGVNTDDIYNFAMKDVIPPIPIISSNAHSLSAIESYGHHSDNMRHGEVPVSHISSTELPVSSASVPSSKKCKYSSILYTDDQPQESYTHLGSDDDNTSITSCEDSHIDSTDAKSEKVEEDVCFPMTEECRVVKGIDFDELNRFVSMQCLKKTDTFSKSRKYSTGSIVRGGFSSRNYLSLNLGKIDDNVFSDNYDNISYKNDPTSSTSGLDTQQKINFKNQQDSIELPDRFSFFSSNTEKTIHVSEIGDILLEGETFQDIFGPDRGTWWLDCLSPTDAEMRMLQKVFSIHPLTAEDIRVQETREKVELFRSYYFVCFRSFEQDVESEDYLEPVNIYIVVFREGLLTFHFSPIVHPANVRRRIRQLRDYVEISSDWICYALIDDITDRFGPCIHSIEHETDAIEDAVLITRDHESREMLRAIGNCRRKVLSLFRLLYGKADVIKMFAKRCTENYNVAPKSEIGLYLGDIQGNCHFFSSVYSRLMALDHLITMTQNLIQFEKILSRSHSNYLAQLSISYVQSNDRSSAMFSKITVIGTIFLPANIITGLFGMNGIFPLYSIIFFNPFSCCSWRT